MPIHTFTTLTASQKLCIGSTCITEAQLDAVLAAIGQSGSAPPSSGQGSASDSPGNQATSTPDTPPIIEISGDNPAIVQVGTTYNDLGATITGPSADLNLSIEASIDGGATTTADQITIDTSQAGTHTILYCATDQSGLAACASRTVNVVSAVSNAATTTDATSTSD